MALLDGVEPSTDAANGAGASKSCRHAVALVAEGACVRGGVSAAKDATSDRQVTYNADDEGVPLGAGNNGAECAVEAGACAVPARSEARPASRGNKAGSALPGVAAAVPEV